MRLRIFVTTASTTHEEIKEEIKKAVQDEGLDDANYDYYVKDDTSNWGIITFQNVRTATHTKRILEQKFHSNGQIVRWASAKNTIFVTGLSEAITTPRLRLAMENFGTVTDCQVFADKKGTSLGYGYCEFQRPSSLADIRAESEKGFLLLDKSGLPLVFKEFQDRELDTGVIERNVRKFRNELSQEPHFVMGWNTHENATSIKFYEAYKEYQEKRKALKEEFDEQIKHLRNEFDSFAAQRPTQAAPPRPRMPGPGPGMGMPMPGGPGAMDPMGAMGGPGMGGPPRGEWGPPRRNGPPRGRGGGPPFGGRGHPMELDEPPFFHHGPGGRGGGRGGRGVLMRGGRGEFPGRGRGMRGGRGRW